MNRTQKQEWIDSTNGAVKSADIVLIAHYKGLSAKEIGDLRVVMRQAGTTFKVAKNRLAERAFKGTPYENVIPLFKGPTALTYAKDPVSAAKALAEFAKKNDKLTLVGGAFGDKLLDKAAIQHLASLPSLDELRAKILAILNTPATRIAGVLQAPAGQLARVFGAYAKKDAA
jgi:large subunit ribosomal protein L10